MNHNDFTVALETVLCRHVTDEEAYAKIVSQFRIAIREKLEKAPMVYSEKRVFSDRVIYSSWRRRASRATHQGRLICVEEVK